MIQIRMLQNDDIDEILCLEELCFPEDPWGRISFENEIDQPLSYFLVAVDEDTQKIIGYGGVWLMYDVGNITNLAVHPKERRAGLGKKILQLLIDLCQEKRMQSVTLEVRRSNYAAQSLYRGAGFLDCGIRRQYYQDKEDAVIMTKILAESENEETQR